MAKKKTWSEKLETAKAPKLCVLDAPFAGLPIGTRLYISSPKEIQAFVFGIKPGETCSIVKMREILASKAGADATCPVSTGIFSRIVAEDALEKYHAGAPETMIAPFWRVIDPASPLAKKLSCDAAFIERKREEERQA